MIGVLELVVTAFQKKVLALPGTSAKVVHAASG